MENRLNPAGEGESQKKEWYKKWWGVIIALVIWPLFAIWYISQKTKWNNTAKGFAIIGVIILAVLIYGGDKSENKPEQNKVAVSENKQTQQETVVAKEHKPEENQEVKKDNAPEEKVTEQKTEEKTADPIKKIEENIKQVSDKFEITIWDSKSNFAKATTPPPYEVIVNAGNGAISNCDSAKVVSFQVMKAVYSDNSIKDKVSRVIFTSWGNLRVSLGSEDGAKMDWSPAMAGPTNFWKVMMQVAPYENESGSLSQRTWGKFISSDCK